MNAFLALVLLLARPMQIGCALGAFLGLSAYFFSSSPTTNSITCEQEITTGEELSKTLRKQLMVYVVIGDVLEQTTSPEYMFEHDEWKALLYEVDSKVEALRQDCRVEASTK